MTELDDESPLRPKGEFRFATEISERWCIGGYANGGFLLSLMIRALGAAFSHADGLTSTGHYLLPVTVGLAEISVEPIRLGKTYTRAIARLTQDGKERLHVVAALVTLPEQSEVAYQAGPTFDLAPLEQCARLVLGTPDGGSAAVRERYDTRYQPGTMGWTRGEPTGIPRFSAWVRPADGTEPDLHTLAVIADAMPCTGFDLGYRTGFSTLEMTVNLRARPAAGWLRCGWSARRVADGWMDEDCEIWDSSGQLVATSRQLLVLPHRV